MKGMCASGRAFPATPRRVDVEDVLTLDPATFRGRNPVRNERGEWEG